MRRRAKLRVIIWIVNNKIEKIIIVIIRHHQTREKESYNLIYSFYFVIRTSDMTPDYDILNGDVLMANGLKMEHPLPIEHESLMVQPQQQAVQQFVQETAKLQLQQGNQLLKPTQQARKQVPRQMAKQLQLTNIKSPEKVGQLDFVQKSNVTIAAGQPAVVQPITTISTATIVDSKPRIKILKKVATGGIANGIATNLTASTTNTLSAVTATTMATAVNTMKDASGTIVINKSNGNFTGNLVFFGFIIYRHIYELLGAVR